MKPTRNSTSAQAISAGAPLVSVEDVYKSFATTGEDHLVLDNINFEVFPGEVLALLGKSGSGKSTLLRCVAGLMTPSSGSVLIAGEQLHGPNPRTAMVFQSFALLPWLTVQQNVELGLEARAVPREEREVKARRAIELIGLDGFEEAFPKELSGGMRQRVGFARALVTEPDVLLMDEPFSALDVLTAETLRNELIELLDSDDFKISSVVIVTHNIEEAVVLADRVAVLSSNPGKIKSFFPIEMPRPRDRNSPQFQGYVDQIYDLLAARTPKAPDVVADDGVTPIKLSEEPLPEATVDGLSGLADILLREGKRTIANLADDLGLDVDDLFPQVDALELLKFADVANGRVELTLNGIEFAEADIRTRKMMFAAAALERARGVRVIANALSRAQEQTLPAGFFRDHLRRNFTDIDASIQLDIAIDWGRYGEIYSYDADSDELVLDTDAPH